MYEFKRILVCLDLSDMDASLLRVSDFISRKVKADKIYFLHVVDSLEINDDILEKYPNLLAPADENVKRLVEDSISRMDNPIETDYEIQVVEGNSTDQVLRWSKIKEIDLIIMGKKIRSDGSGILPDKIVKVCHCSFLLVPELDESEIKSIVAPIDFSASSKMALEYAIYINKLRGGVDIRCLHVYRVPTGYHTTGKSYEEFAEIMKSNAAKEYDQFVQKCGKTSDEIPCDFVLDDHNNPAKVIGDFLTRDPYKLMVIGSMGRSGLASVILGSTAMKLCREIKKTPMLVVKDKNHNLGILEAILRI